MFYSSAYIKATFEHSMFRTALNRQARPNVKLLLMPHITVSEFLGKKNRVPMVMWTNIKLTTVINVSVDRT